MKKMKLDIQLFNGSVAIQTITETTNIDTNQSTFTIPAKMTTTGATYNNSNASMTLQWKYASASSWTSISKQTFKIGKNSSVTKSWTLTLAHNDDGSLENVQFRVSWYITDSTNGTTGATTFTPTYIPRKSDIQNITSGTTDYAPTLTWTPASSSFKFIIRYLYGDWYYQTDWITPNSTAQQTFNSYTITGSSIAPYMTNTTTASVLASLYTYTSDGNLVGDSNVYFNVSLNNNIVPSVSFSSVSEAGDVPSSWGVYVKTKSRVALGLTASGIYGSTISGYGISYYGGSIQNASGTTSYLTQAGSTTFTGQVTDTRGRSASTTTTINVIDYYNPTISTAQVQRCDVDGNIDNNGEYMYISYGASISPVSNKNTPSAVYKVGYRVQNTGDYQYVPLTTNANSYSASGMLYTDGIYAANRGSGTKVQFSSSNTFDIQFYVQDYFTNSTNVQTLDTGFDLMNFNPSGKAMAIGKVSEAGANEELFEVGMNTNINGNLRVDGIINSIIGSTGQFSKTDTQNCQAQTSEIIVFNHTDYVDNNCFELQNDGKIKVLKDISKVQVNVNVRTDDWGGIIYVGVDGYGDYFNCQTNETMACASGVLPVYKNATIYVRTYRFQTGYVFGYDRAWCGINVSVLK